MMVKLQLFFLLQLLYVLSVFQKTYLDSPANLERYRLFRNWITRSIGTYSDSFIILCFLFFIKRKIYKSKSISWRKNEKKANFYKNSDRKKNYFYNIFI